MLDSCDEASARFLLQRGTVLTPHVASRLGWFDELRQIVHADGAEVHERGGDGQQPRLGFDPCTRGTDGGTALHMACWMGHVPLVERLLALNVPVDEIDPTHGSTPLGWAAFGSVHRRAGGADYLAVVDRLLAAGASLAAGGNGAGRSMVEMAEGNPEAQAALRRRGAR